MKNEKPKKTYSEIMESLKKLRKENQRPLIDTYVQMIIDEALFTRQLVLLEEKINDALDSNNKPLFFELSTEYAKLKPIVLEERRKTKVN